jgi:hypothetical protein
MIFDRIDILVVCIILGTCVCIAEAFLGFWNTFADCFIITFLISEVCYTKRCNEKLQIELIETKEKLNDAESDHLEIAKKSKLVNLYTLLMKLWRERWSCEHAKVNYCKHRITLRQLIDAMNHFDKRCDDISNKISELTKDLNELDK